MGGDHAAVPRVRGDELTLPFRIEQVLPRLGRLRGGDDLGVVRDDVHGGAEPVVIAVLVLEGRREAVDAGGRVFHQELLVLQQHVVARVGGVDHIRDLEVGLELLHDTLEDPLGAGPVDLDLDPRIRRLEELGDLLRACEREGGVPDDLTFLLRGLEARVLSGQGACGEDQAERGGEAHRESKACHRTPQV